MPLSAQSMRRYLDGPGSRYEVFEHVSWVCVANTTTRTAPQSSGVLYGSVVVQQANSRRADGPGAADGVARSIPTATVVGSAPSPSTVIPSPPPHVAATAGSVQLHGILYLCTLPKVMWDSVGAVDVNSPPSQRQLAFTTEAPAFSASHNTSFALNTDASGERPTHASPNTTVTSTPHVAAPKNFSNVGQGHQRHPSGAEECAFASMEDRDAVAEEGIQLPGVSTPAGYRVKPPPTNYRVPQQFVEVEGHDRRPFSVHADYLTLAAPIVTDGSVTPFKARAQATAPHPKDLESTVRVLLFMAIPKTTTAAGESTDAAISAVSNSIPHEAPGTALKKRDGGDPKVKVVEPPDLSGGGNHKGVPSSVTAGPVNSSLPQCVCFAIHDVAEVESDDTEIMASRERRVQRLTMLLESGAEVYTAKSSTDIFGLDHSRVDSARSCPSTRASEAGITTTSHSSSSCKLFPFLFHQGGITRCVAALRRCAPHLVYTCHAGRPSPSLPSSAASGAVGTGRTVMALPFFLEADGAGNPIQDQAENVTKLGWRKRFAAGTFLRGTAGGVGGLLFHHAGALRNDDDTSLSAHSTSTSIASAPNPLRVASRASHTANANAHEKERSSASSFEDLADEMTAIRLGPVYTPPKPFLPLFDGTGHHNGSGMAPLSAIEWKSVFDSVPAQTPPSVASAAAGWEGDGSPTPQTVYEARLNADRWRAFRLNLYRRGGLADSDTRFHVWCYLLGAYPVGSSDAEQAEILANERSLYERLTHQWKSFLPEQEAHFAAYRYAKQSIVKDVERTDRTHPTFREDDSDMLRALRELLLAHVMLDMDLGYSQGMSDVAAVALLVTLSATSLKKLPPQSLEAAMFLCFRRILSEHMSNNFIIEERKISAPYAAVKGLQRKLYQAQVLTRHFYPALYAHLKRHCAAEDMSMCFRWLLVCFKRDLPSLSDTMRLWDVLFACPFTTAYEVVISVALLGALMPQITTHIHAYETLLQYMNSLSSSISLDQILECARVFYENVCVPETRELRRCLRRKVVDAAAATAGSVAGDSAEALADRQAEPNRKSAVTAMPAIEADAVKCGDDTRYFPTVEEMTLLFLKTDGPL